VLGRAASIEEPVLIDAKLGEINGRPVRAEEVFARMGDRLHQEARQEGMTRARWLRQAREHIYGHLFQLLQDELLQAEALASLRPEQRMGLRYFVQEMSENKRREAGGSRAAAERRLREETEHQTLQHAAREREAKLLVEHQLRERIRHRVRVSWKDVQLYYERNSDLYNPPSTARFRMIRVPASNSEGVQKVQESLESGIPFATVAATAENTYQRERGGLRPEVKFTGNYATAEMDLPGMLEAAQRLRPGEWTRQPVEYQGDKRWLYLESIQSTSRPLSNPDVQREIADLLTQSGFEAELALYIMRLQERASYTDLEEMTQRLVEIASERYWRD
jgi:hypothetical protein